MKDFKLFIVIYVLRICITIGGGGVNFGVGDGVVAVDFSVVMVIKVVGFTVVAVVAIVVGIVVALVVANQ